MPFKNLKDHFEEYWDIEGEKDKERLLNMTEDELRQELYALGYTPESLQKFEDDMKKKIDSFLGKRKKGTSK